MFYFSLQVILFSQDNLLFSSTLTLWVTIVSISLRQWVYVEHLNQFWKEDPSKSWYTVLEIFASNWCVKVEVFRKDSFLNLFNKILFVHFPINNTVTKIIPFSLLIVSLYRFGQYRVDMSPYTVFTFFFFLSFSHYDI